MKSSVKFREILENNCWSFTENLVKSWEQFCEKLWKKFREILREICWNFVQNLVKFCWKFGEILPENSWNFKTVACTRCVLLATCSKFLTFASASTSELAVCKLDGVQHILWFDHWYQLAGDCAPQLHVNVIWQYAARPASSHATHRQVKTSVKASLFESFSHIIW